MLDSVQGHDLEAILRTLTEVIDWCLPRALRSDPKSCLRTPSLNPEPLAGYRRDVVDSVARARHFGLKWPQARKTIDLAGGRLLGYEPDQNLSDGAAELESEGFFDVLNVPPWDTWVAYAYETSGRNYLVSWVPAIFVGVATGGIDVNPEACIWWLDEEETCLSGLLREQGILIPYRSMRRDPLDGRQNPMWDSELDRS
jgi:hypothetical protein